MRMYIGVATGQDRETGDPMVGASGWTLTLAEGAADVMDGAINELWPGMPHSNSATFVGEIEIRGQPQVGDVLLLQVVEVFDPLALRANQDLNYVHSDDGC